MEALPTARARDDAATRAVALEPMLIEEGSFQLLEQDLGLRD